MLRRSRARLLLALIALGIPTLVGCGGRGALPRGQVVADGQPYPFADGEKMAVTFRTTFGGPTASAEVRKDGTFAVTAPALPAGTYKVNLISTMTGPDVPADQKYKDRFGGAFGEAISPLQVEVGGESAPNFTIDLTRKTATKS
jgi:hypothetical protein